MATVIQNTIGTGGDYSTVQSWEDAAPVDLVAADEIWEGQVLPQKISFSQPIQIAGSTSSASCYKHLTAQAGGSFADNPTHALMYDDTNGATLHRTDGYQQTINNTENYFRLSRLQVSGFTPSIYTTALQGVIVEDCILYASHAQAFQSRDGTTTKVINCLLLTTNNNTKGLIESGDYYYSCTLAVLKSGTTTPAVTPGYSTLDLVNCVFSNVTLVAASRPAQVTCENCFTTGDPFAGCTVVALDETTGTGWVDASLDLTGDLKIRPTSALVDAGMVATPYTDFDIYGTPRGAAPDVGCYEIGGPPVGVDHATDGDVTGNTADVTGDAVLTEPATVHQATGAVAGLTSNVTGTAKRFLLHTTSGDVVDSNDATVTGQAELINAVYLHETEGVLTGQLGTVSGTSRRFRTHPTDGIVIGDPWATVEGLAEIVSPPGEHETYGVLTGQHGTVVGTAKHLRKHTTTGALAGRTAVVTGDASKFAEHDSSGIIVGYDSKVIGSATNVGSLTLTPADIAAIVAALKAEILPVNIVRVNHIDVDGTGSPGDEWGPV